MSIMDTHQKNIQEYRRLGGSEQEIKKLSFSSIQNRAKLVYLINELKKNVENSSEVVKEKEQEPIPAAKSSPPTNYTPQSNGHKLLGIISQYPVALHSTYQKGFDAWLKSCSLKIQLNELSIKQSKEAVNWFPSQKIIAMEQIYELQVLIFNCFQIFNKSKKILDYYNTEKRIMPTETSSDFSTLTPLQLLQKRNSLRGLISRRKATIEKKEKELPVRDNPLYQKRIAMLNKKKEELQILVLDLEKVEKLLKNKEI